MQRAVRRVGGVDGEAQAGVVAGAARSVEQLGVAPVERGQLGRRSSIAMRPRPRRDELVGDRVGLVEQLVDGGRPVEQRLEVPVHAGGTKRRRGGGGSGVGHAVR